MLRAETKDIPCFLEIEPLVRSLGYLLVEISVGRTKGSSQVRVIISKDASVGVQDCFKVHSALQPRLGIILNSQDIHLEVTSPGIDRVFKDAREFEIFQGRRVKVMKEGESDWIPGIIEKASSAEVFLKTQKEQMVLDYKTIHKAKLDYIQEAR